MNSKLRTGRTPPHKKFRKLRLFDTPHTPKTLLQKSSQSPKTQSPRMRLFQETNNSTTKFANKVLNFDDTSESEETSKPKAKMSPHSPFQFNQQLQANINPFTPTNSFDNNSKLTSASNAAAMVRLAHQKSIKRSLCSDSESQSLDQEEELVCPASSSLTNKRLALRQCLVSRYHEEFHEVCKLGSGEFGDVFKCINRLDGCTYAIKRSKKPIAGSASEVSAWKEVCAHAVLVKHNHIVQYYSAWAEADRMLIQNEYCNGGSLAEFIESLKMNNNSATDPEPALTSSCLKSKLLMSEFDLKTLLLHIAKGLAYMHSLNLVHLDIKPGNIFICRTLPRPSCLETTKSRLVLNEESGIESDEIEDDDTNTTTRSSLKNSNSIFSEMITYKIGDLGHVTSTLDPHVEEGDCRYLPNEILQENYDNLSKADVFALALTIYVCGSLEELPKNGDEWHSIRRGNLRELTQCSDRFNKLLTVIFISNTHTMIILLIEDKSYFILTISNVKKVL